jgi:hypothetical protein
MDKIRLKIVKKGPIYRPRLSLSKESDTRRVFYAVDKIKNDSFPTIKQIIVLNVTSEGTSPILCEVRT